MKRRRFLSLFGLVAARPKLLLVPPPPAVSRYCANAYDPSTIPPIQRTYIAPETIEELARELSYRAGVAVDQLVREAMNG